MRRRAGELRDGDAAEARLQRMLHGELLVGRRLDHLRDAHDVAPLVRSEGEPEGARVGDDVEHAAVRHVYRHRAQRGHLDGAVEVHGEGRDVLEGHAPHLAVRAFRAHADEARGRFEDEIGYRLAHGQHARFEEHRDHADRVGAGHAWILDLLHDHVAGLGFRMCRRQEHVAVGGGITARLAQHARAELIAMRLQVLRLVEHGRAGHVEHAAHDHAPGLSRRVRVHGLDHPGEAHRALRGAQRTASMRRGPRVPSAEASWRLNSSAVVARVASTPMPRARATQSRSGRPMSSMSAAFFPGVPAPTPASSWRRMAYVRLANTTVVMSRPSRAWVQSAWTVYMPLPSPSRHTTFRSGHATAAPVASGRPRPIEPPMLFIQSCGGAPAVMRKKPRPVVTDSSATIAPSGKRAPSEAASVSGVSGPVGSAGRLAACTTSPFFFPPTSSPSHSRAVVESSASVDSRWISQPSAVSTLGLSGYAKNATGAFAPTRIRWRMSFSTARACSTG